MVLTGSRASAADLYWDSNGNAAGFGNTTGTWGTDDFVALAGKAAGKHVPVHFIVFDEEYFGHGGQGR